MIAPYGENIDTIVELDDYQERAGRTNLWPRVFTEQQVRNICSDLVTEYFQTPFSELDAFAINDLIDKHTTALSRALYHVLGLMEEAGELSGKFKKTIRDDNGVITDERKDAILKEQGDGLWYQAAIAQAFGWDLSHVARENLKKLTDRAKRGVLRGSGDNR